MHRRAVLAAVVFLASAGQIASGQTVTQSTLSGIETTASVTVVHNLTGTAAATVFATSAAGFFILTQACFTHNNRVVLSGNTFGVVVHRSSGGRKCTTYSPGITLPKSETLTCTNTSKTADQTCTITGIVSSK